MKHVFDNLSKVDIKRLIKGVEESVLALWPTAGNDFRRFDNPNGTTVVVNKQLVDETEMITVHIKDKNDSETEEFLERVTFPTTKVARRNVFMESAEELALEVSLQIKERQLT